MINPVSNILVLFLLLGALYSQKVNVNNLIYEIKYVKCGF